VRAVSANRLCAVSGADDSTCRVWRFVDDFVLRKEEVLSLLALLVQKYTYCCEWRGRLYMLRLALC
jgi:hypothetical protein